MDKCKLCDNTFKRKYRAKGLRKIYCSKKCKYADAYIEKTCITCNKVFIKNKLSFKSDIFCSLSCIQRHPCENCGKIITGRKTFQSLPKRFCGRACASFVNRTLKAKKTYVAKGFAQSIYWHGKIICNRCFIEDIEVLVVHHMDKNKENNAPENLETLCANCHHKEHWGKGNNRIKMSIFAHKISQK